MFARMASKGLVWSLPQILTADIDIFGPQFNKSILLWTQTKSDLFYNIKII